MAKQGKRNSIKNFNNSFNAFGEDDSSSSSSINGNESDNPLSHKPSRKSSSPHDIGIDQDDVASISTPLPRKRGRKPKRNLLRQQENDVSDGSLDLDESMFLESSPHQKDDESPTPARKRPQIVAHKRVDALDDEDFFTFHGSSSAVRQTSGNTQKKNMKSPSLDIDDVDDISSEEDKPTDGFKFTAKDIIAIEDSDAEVALPTPKKRDRSLTPPPRSKDSPGGKRIAALLKNDTVTTYEKEPILEVDPELQEFLDQNEENFQFKYDHYDIVLCPYKDPRNQLPQKTKSCRLRPSDSFEKIMKMYSTQLKTTEPLTYLYNLVSVSAYNTPSSLALGQSSTLYVLTRSLYAVLKQEWKENKSLYDPTSELLAIVDDGEDHSEDDSDDESGSGGGEFCIKLSDKNRNLEMIQVRKSTKIAQIISHYRKLKGLSASSSVHLLLEGEQLDPTATIGEVDIEEDELIDVKVSG